MNICKNFTILYTEKEGAIVKMWILFLYYFLITGFIGSVAGSLNQDYEDIDKALFLFVFYFLISWIIAPFILLKGCYRTIKDWANEED